MVKVNARYLWAIDWDDTIAATDNDTVLPYSSARELGVGTLGVGPYKRDVTTAITANGSIQVYDPDGFYDPLVANAARRVLLSKPHRAFMYALDSNPVDETLRWRGWMIVGQRPNDYTAIFTLLGEDYARQAADTQFPELFNSLAPPPPPTMRPDAPISDVITFVVSPRGEGVWNFSATVRDPNQDTVVYFSHKPFPASFIVWTELAPVDASTGTASALVSGLGAGTVYIGHATTRDDFSGGRTYVFGSAADDIPDEPEPPEETPTPEPNVQVDSITGARGLPNTTVNVAGTVSDLNNAGGTLTVVVSILVEDDTGVASDRTVLANADAGGNWSSAITGVLADRSYTITAKVATGSTQSRNIVIPAAEDAPVVTNRFRQLDAIRPTDSSMRLVGYAAGNVTSGYFRWRTSTGTFGPATSAQTVSGGSVTYDVTGLSPSTSYVFQVSHTADFQDPVSTIASTTATPIVPELTGFSVTNITRTSARVVVLANTQAVGSRVSLQFGPPDPQGRLTRTVTGTVISGIVTFVQFDLTQLTAGTTYTLTARIQGRTESISGTFRTTAPAVVEQVVTLSNLRTSNVDATSARATVSVANATSTTRIYWRTVTLGGRVFNTGSSLVASIPGGGRRSSYSTSGLTPSTRYTIEASPDTSFRTGVVRATIRTLALPTITGVTYSNITRRSATATITLSRSESGIRVQAAQGGLTYGGVTVGNTATIRFPGLAAGTSYSPSYTVVGSSVAAFTTTAFTTLPQLRITRLRATQITNNPRNYRLYWSYTGFISSEGDRFYTRERAVRRLLPDSSWRVGTTYIGTDGSGESTGSWTLPVQDFTGVVSDLNVEVSIDPSFPQDSRTWRISISDGDTSAEGSPRG